MLQTKSCSWYMLFCFLASVICSFSTVSNSACPKPASPSLDFLNYNISITFLVVKDFVICLSYVLCLPGISFVSVQFSSVAQSCLTLYDPMDCSMPGLPVHHQHLECTKTHAHWLVMPSQPLLSPSPPTFNLSQHQGLFK